MNARKGTRSANSSMPSLRRRARSEEHTSELQSHLNLVCRLLLEKKKTPANSRSNTTRSSGVTRHSDQPTDPTLSWVPTASPTIKPSQPPYPPPPPPPANKPLRDH